MPWIQRLCSSMLLSSTLYCWDPIWAPFPLLPPNSLTSLHYLLHRASLVPRASARVLSGFIQGTETSIFLMKLECCVLFISPPRGLCIDLFNICCLIWFWIIQERYICLWGRKGAISEWQAAMNGGTDKMMLSPSLAISALLKSMAHLHSHRKTKHNEAPISNNVLQKIKGTLHPGYH